MDVQADAGPALTRAEAVGRARSLYPLMRESARRADDGRRLLPEMVEAFSATGLIGTLVPRRWGGSELDLTTHMEIAIELGRAYGSMAWVASFLIDHPFILAHFGDEAQHDVWGVSGPSTPIGTSFAPVGKVTPVSGGWTLSGDWGWASGIDYARWIMLGGMVPASGGHPEYRLFLVPVSDVTIVDTWYSAGLRGSGSNNVIADSVFVPEHRTVAMSTLLEGCSPGGAVNQVPLYNQPFMAHGGHAMVSPAIGIARGMAEAWTEHVRTKTHSHSQEQVAAAVPMQITLAEAAVRIDSAELLLRRSLAMVDSGAVITLEDRVRNRRDVTYVSRILVRAAEDLMQMAGASALRDDSPVQRGWRDVRAISCHVFCNFNAAAENYGRMEFGFPLNPRDAFV